MQVEHLHQWFREATQEKDTDNVHWRKFVALVQVDFQ